MGRSWYTMILKIGLAVVLAVAAANGQNQQARNKGQLLTLAPGDFRWIPFSVRQTPSEIDCHFDVIQGSPTVHVELLPMSEFRRFDRGLEHDTLAITPASRSGDFRRIINTTGQYAVVVKNGKGAPPATVSLQLRNNLNPDANSVARTLSPERRLAVILISFAFFFISVTWSARALIRNMRAS